MVVILMDDGSAVDSDIFVGTHDDAGNDDGDI